MVIRTLTARKALDPVVLDLKEMTSFTDYFVICSGTSHRQVQALANHVEEALVQAGQKPLGVEGKEEGQWVLLDFNDVIIHIFFQPWRDFYDLEGLWSEAERVPWETEALRAELATPQEMGA